MATRRRYELKKRAEQQQETRRRITEATIELHRTVGPAATRITEVARRAGVERMTVYNHFPDEASLLTACSAHWRGLHPTPDLSAWTAIPDPGARLRTGLRAHYAWYRETEPMTANVLRDAEAMPDLAAVVDAGLGVYLEDVRRLLAEPFRARGARLERIRAAIRVVVDVHCWQALANLGDAQAAELAARFVEAAR